MAKVVNLNRFRKDKARSEKRALGDSNAAKFGRNKAEKTRDEMEQSAAERHLDGHRRDAEPEDPKGDPA